MSLKYQIIIGTLPKIICDLTTTSHKLHITVPVQHLAPVIEAVSAASAEYQYDIEEGQREEAGELQLFILLPFFLM